MADHRLQLYEFAHMLIQNGHFDVIHFQDHADELWLERYENKTSTVIRLIHRGFDWKNHLKRDIAITLQRAKKLKPKISGKRMEICNVYFSPFAPVDDWESLKKPIHLKEKQSIKMKVYYIDREEGEDEKNRLLEDLAVEYSISPSPNEEEKDISGYKHYIHERIKRKKAEITNIFSYGKPIFTYLFIAVNLLLYFFMELANGNELETLIAFGAKYNVAIVEANEWWRLFTSMFIHIGFLHLFMNMVAVYYLGMTVERIFGSIRFLFIYFLAGIAGSIASFAFSPNISAGASGAIFGLFGALLVFGIHYKHIFRKTMGFNLLFILGINIAVGFVLPQIDMAAHLGGLAGGFLAAQMIHLPRKRHFRKQLLSALLLALLLGIGVPFGIQQNESSQTYQLMKIEELIKKEEYESVIHVSTDALQLKGDYDGVLLFHRSYAYIELGKYENAIKDLEESLSYDIYPESYYNLALLYMEIGEKKLAELYAKKAFDMNPDNESFIELYENIMDEKQ